MAFYGETENVLRTNHKLGSCCSRQSFHRYVHRLEDNLAFDTQEEVTTTLVKAQIREMK
jgi:hypothetical protein